MTAASSILVVEDEPQMRKFLRASLSSNGYRVLEAATANEGVMLLTSRNPELILLDLGLPDADGIELTRQIREWSRTPIVVVSARGREDDKVAALDAGADDYLTKPFGVSELLARVRVALRHARAVVAPEAPPVIEVGALVIDRVRREVTRGGVSVHLTPTEYKLLVLLAENAENAENAGKVLTHRQILKAVWGPTHGTETHYVRVHMAELRRKIEAEPSRPRILITEPGVGYRLREPPGG